MPGVRLPALSRHGSAALSRHLSEHASPGPSGRDRPTPDADAFDVEAFDVPTTARCRRSLLAASVGWRLVLAGVGIAVLWLMVYWAVALP